MSVGRQKTPEGLHPRTYYEMRWARFARAVHAGKHPFEAYVEAGYAPHATHAHRLLKHKYVRKYTRYLEVRTLKKHDINLEKILNDLEEARLLAKSGNQAAPMIQASMAQAKLCGLITDKQEVRNVSDMDLRELTERIREGFGEDADVVLDMLGILDNKTDSSPSADKSSESTVSTDFPMPMVKGTETVN